LVFPFLSDTLKRMHTQKTPIIALIALGLACSAAFAQDPASQPNAPSQQNGTSKKIAWDRKKSQYLPEPGVKLKLSIDDAAWGAAISALWDRIHPEAAGAVELEIVGAAGSANRLSSLADPGVDLALVVASEASLRPEAFLVLDPGLAKTAMKELQREYYDLGNPDGQCRVLPVAYEGMVFGWNATMLAALGLDVADNNKDGLPDAFDTWEEIFALSVSWKANRPSYSGEPLESVFPFCLDDPWSCYPIVSAGGWSIFQEGDALKPGFEKSSFRDGLEFIKTAAEAMACVDASGKLLPAATCVWRWDGALEGRGAPFGLFGSWMDVRGTELKYGHDLRFGPMPTWRKNRPSPFARAKAFAVNARTAWPSAAQELMRILFTKEGMQAMVDATHNPPILAAKSTIKPDYADPNLPEIVAAFAYDRPEPVLRLPGGSGKQAMDLYYSIGVNRAYRAVWDGSKTPEEAQAVIFKRSFFWLLDNAAPGGSSAIKTPSTAD
jgi:arabinogalactan oligomer / maltooligosaccharide transport system substrate-binding protein